MESWGSQETQWGENISEVVIYIYILYFYFEKKRISFSTCIDFTCQKYHILAGNIRTGYGLPHDIIWFSRLSKI